MSALSKFLRRTSNGYAHWCPGCQEMHAIAVDSPRRNGAIWTFDGNADCPTFSPSVNISSPECKWEGGIVPAMRCHYFLHGGKLQFLSDCTHALAGQTIDLPPLPEGLS